MQPPLVRVQSLYKCRWDKRSLKYTITYPKGIKITIYYKSYIRTLTIIDVIQMEGVNMILHADYKILQLIRKYQSKQASFN